MNNRYDYNTKASVAGGLGSLLQGLYGGRQQAVQNNQVDRKLGYVDPNRPLGDNERARMELEAKIKAQSLFNLMKTFPMAQNPSSIGVTPQQPSPQGQGYQVGQVIDHGGKKYRVVGGDPNDPDVELVQ